MKRLFFGGIHPADKKDLTCHKELISFLQPDYVAISLSQHIGTPCQPLVKVGDYVVKGQKIGDGEGLCVPVHASVSGTVTAVIKRPHTRGGEMMAVVIKNDKKHILDKNLEPGKELKDLSPEELFGLIREAGIVGMGGAAFPTDRKAATAMNKADTLLINGCECEPYITSDDFVMKNWPAKVIGGIVMLAKALKPERVVLAVEDNKKAAIEAIREQLKENNIASIELVVLPARYPQGGEKQLIQAVTGREVPAGKLPADAGCIVFNVSTVYAVYKAVREGMPLIERVVTVTGNGILHPGNYLVPIGTSFSDLIHAAGGLKEGCDRVIAGGPMMGMAQSSLEVPVMKNTGSIICLIENTSKYAGQKENLICIRCGKCVQVCPMKLLPLYLYRYGKAGNANQLEQYHLSDCIECGCCSYTCPAKLPLTEQFRSDKKVLREGRTS